MSWGKLSYWLRGGIIGLICGAILFIIRYLVDPSFFTDDPINRFQYLFANGIGSGLANLWNYVVYNSLTMTIIVFGILGAIFGALYGISKRRKK